MRIPVREYRACEMLEDRNFPSTFEYTVLNKAVVSQTRQMPQAPAPVAAPAPNHGHAMGGNISVTQTVNVSPVNPATAIQNLDLNNINSVVQVYKVLFPNGQAIDPKVVAYKSVLEGILTNKGINVHSM